MDLNFRTRPVSTLRKKEEKKSLVFQKTVIESTFDYGIAANFEYWIVNFMNGLLNEQTKSVFPLMHQSIPPAPRPPRADPRELASRGWGLLSWQIPRGGDEKTGQMPRPPSTVQHFLLIAQSNSAILIFLFKLTSSFVIALGF